MTSHTKYTEEHKCSDTFPNVFYAAFLSLQYDLRFYFFYLNQMYVEKVVVYLYDIVS